MSYYDDRYKEQIGFFELRKEIINSAGKEIIYLILGANEQQSDLLDWIGLSEGSEGIGHSVYQFLIEKIIKDNRPDMYLNMWTYNTKSNAEGFFYEVDMCDYSISAPPSNTENELRELRELAEFFTTILTKEYIEELKKDPLFSERIMMQQEIEEALGF